MPVCQLCNKRCRVQRFDSRLLEGDTFYDYFCPDCSHTTEGTFERHPLSWQTVIHLVLYHLQRTAANANTLPANANKRLFFRWKEDICGFIERHWNDLIPQKNPGVSWQNSVSSVLSAHHDVFANGLEEKGETGWWSLRQCEPPRLKVSGGVTAGGVNNATVKRHKRTHPDSDRESDNEYDDDNDGVEIKSEAGSIDLMLDEQDDNNNNNNINNRHHHNNDSEDRLNESHAFGNDSVVKSEQIKKQLLSRLLSVDTTLLKQALSKVKEDKQMHDAKARLATDSSNISAPTSISGHGGSKTKISARAPPVENELLRILSRIKNPDYKMRRLRRKLLSRRERRRAGMELFDLDAYIYNYLKEPRPLDPKGNKIIGDNNEQQDQSTSTPNTPSLQITAPYHQNKYLSLRYKIMGISACFSEYPPVDFVSPFSGRPLPPYIRRDEDMFLQSKRGQLMHSLNRLFHSSQPNSIDFMHLRREHVPQLNRLLSSYFWPNIDITESADFPDYSIIAVYNRWLIIGAALLDPDGYLSHLFVRPDWSDAGIGACLLHLALQSAPPRDIRLHCSATNPAMLLYNRFGFKPEAFIVNHYDKYLRMAEQSDECVALSTVLPFSRHAFLMRLRR